MFSVKNLFLWMLTSCYLTPWRSVPLHSLLFKLCFILQWQAVRPKLQMAKNLEEAAIAVDEMYNSAYQAAG